MHMAIQLQGVLLSGLVRRHHSLFEAQAAKWDGCGCMFLAHEKAKQNVTHWAIWFCLLLQKNQMLSLTFSAFSLDVWAGV